jgi:hypothetical protein
MFRNWFKREPMDDITAVAHLVRAVMRDEPQWKEIRITKTPGGVEYVLNRGPATCARSASEDPIRSEAVT